MIDYASIAADTAATIADVGTSATLYRKGTAAGPEYDPVHLPEVPFAIHYVDISGTVSDRSSSISPRSISKTGDLIAIISHTILVAVYAGGPPKKDDTVDLGGTRLRVVSVTTTAPAGIDVVYELGLAA
jgi:hypothetical protein